MDANYQNTHLGYIQFSFKIDTIFDVIKANINALIVILLFVCFISYLLAIFFAKKFTEPILDLVKFLEKVYTNESYRKRVITQENNEYGKTIRRSKYDVKSY